MKVISNGILQKCIFFVLFYLSEFTDGQQNAAGGNNYQDRAASRRLKVGSSTDKEKTQAASVDTYEQTKQNKYNFVVKFHWLFCNFFIAVQFPVETRALKCFLSWDGIKENPWESHRLVVS